VISVSGTASPDLEASAICAEREVAARIAIGSFNHAEGGIDAQNAC
jgi:hypothetical protein